MIEIIDDVLDSAYCDFCVDKLLEIDKWRIASDLKRGYRSGNYGHILRTKSPDITHVSEDLVSLNTLAELLVFKIVNTQDFGRSISECFIYRIYWNHYNQNGFVHDHEDMSKENCYADDGWEVYSIIFHLMDNDSFNVVGGKQIKTVKNRCILFNSEITHSSTPSQLDPHRFTLNVIFCIK